MQKLVWQNANGVELDLTSGNYGVTEWEGFSNTGLNIQTQTVPFQDGGVFLDALIEQRELTVTLAMQDNNNLELRYQQRRELISALNPKLGEGYLIYTNDFISKRIKCVPQIPIFETHNSDTAGTPKASLSWTACEPYWEDLEDTVVEFDPSEQVTIQNEGDVPAQLEIEFKTGNVTNPSITRVNGGKKIQYNGTLMTDLFINTNQGKKKAETYDIGLKISSFGLAFEYIVYSQKHDLYVGLTESELMTSKDLKNWDLIMYNSTYSFYSLAYAEDKDLFCVTWGGSSLTDRKTITSTDGVNWTVHNVSTFDNKYIQKSLVYIDSLEKFYTTADSGEIFYSTDGVSWTIASTLTGLAHIDKIVYSESLQIFVVTGYKVIAYSSDGTNWTTVNLSDMHGGCSDMIYVKDFGLFIGVGIDLITSPDGVNWTIQTIDSEVTAPLNSITYSRKLGKAFITTHNTYPTQNGYVLSSADGINWDISEPYLTTLHNIGSLDYAGLIWLAGLTFTSYRASEGTFEIPHEGKDFAPLKIIYVAEKGFYIGTFRSSIGSGLPFIAKSYDGVDWEIVPFDTGFETYSYHDLIYSRFLDSIIIPVSAGSSPYTYYFLKSSDGENWTVEEQEENIWVLVSAENQEKLVGMSLEGSYVSTDGVNWTQTSSLANCQKIVYSEKLRMFITSVHFGALWSSPDGVTWTERFGGTAPVWYINKISLWKNGFVAKGSGSSSLICYSEDGINWAYRSTPYEYSDIYYSEFEGALYLTWGNAPNYAYKTYNLVDWEILTDVYFDPYIAIANPINQVLFWGGRVLYTGILGMKNVIQDLSQNSDINLNLALGENIFTLNLAEGSFKCILKYRQKYIGV